MKIKANSIHIEVEDTGPGLNAQGVERPVVLLIMGLGMQLIAWPPDFVKALVEAGYRVIRHDNRDVGLSQHFDDAGVPNLMWSILKHRVHLPVKPAYTLGDMANDALGVLDALQVRQAHVVGVSMGGMIAQRLALVAPLRLLSLTSIMSSSGARGLPEAGSDVVKALLSRPKSSAPSDVADYFVSFLRVIGSPGFPMTEAQVRERILAGVARSYHPQGTARQTQAVIADTARAALLGRIQTPTLVMHGRQDALVPFACGEDTARRIPGSKFVAIDGMGHDLAPGVVERLLPPLLQHFSAATQPG
jgi:pimeloyl-ACP methyl ester carboxylesterase